MSEADPGILCNVGLMQLVLQHYCCGRHLHSKYVNFIYINCAYYEAMEWSILHNINTQNFGGKRGVGSYPFHPLDQPLNLYIQTCKHTELDGELPYLTLFSAARSSAWDILKAIWYCATWLFSVPRSILTIWGHPITQLLLIYTLFIWHYNIHVNYIILSKLQWFINAAN